MLLRHKYFFIGLLFVFSGLCGFVVSYYLHMRAPEEQVQLIKTFHYPASFVKQLAGDPAAGKKIFKEFCSSCHGQQPTIDINAPRIGDHKAWRARKKMGMPALLKITVMGAGAMPARGGCFECSDEQLEMTIRYILSRS